MAELPHIEYLGWLDHLSRFPSVEMMLAAFVKPDDPSDGPDQDPHAALGALASVVAQARGASQASE